MPLEKGRFLRHDPCEACGSSDAKAVYSNGTAFCFSCRKYYPKVEGEVSKQPRMSTPLLTGLEYRPLQKRGIHEETCRKYGYGIAKWRGKTVQVAPYYFRGALAAQHIRTPDKEFFWTGEAKHLELFGQHLWRNGGKRIVVTEGEIDCLTVAQVFGLNWPVVSVPNGAQSAKKYIQQNLEFLEAFEEIVLAFDNDEPGRQAAEECAAILTPGKVKIANWGPYKDANDWMQAGRGADIAKIIFEAKQFRPDGIVAGSDLSFEYLVADEGFFTFSLPYPILDQKLRGLRKGELTLITAGSGVGKSTLSREVAYHLAMEHGLKVGYVALEESVKKSAIGIIAIRLNVPMGDLFLNKDLVPREDFKRAYEETLATDRFYFYDHFGSLDSENLISKLKFLAVGLGVDFIVLDHISIVVSGIEDGDERRIIDNLMTALRSLAENTGVGLLVVSHLKVPEGKPHEEGGRVTLSHLRGSGALKQLSDNIIALERNQQGEDPDKSLIRVLKNRLFGDLGPADHVRYNKETGRLLPEEEPEESNDFDGGDDTGLPSDDDLPF